MNKVLGIVLILAGLWLGYVGVSKLTNNTNQINFLGIKIDASNEKGQTKGIIYLVGALALCAGGYVAIQKSGSRA